MRHIVEVGDVAAQRFQSTHPLRGATVAGSGFIGGAPNFNPRTPCGVRQRAADRRPVYHSFQSTHPLRGATRLAVSVCSAAAISIHAPLAGCDSRYIRPARRAMNFNPRTPCGVRLNNPFILLSCENFNPRTPCGVRPPEGEVISRELQFQSTHPLRGATKQMNDDGSALEFQSTHPLRGATRRARLRRQRHRVFQSTHPLRGATPHEVLHGESRGDFNPRTPCGVRRARGVRLVGAFHFNPRTPCGVRLYRCFPRRSIRHFNPRTPCGVRPGSARSLPLRAYFNPRTPCGVRPTYFFMVYAAKRFQSTHPLRGATNAKARIS